MEKTEGWGCRAVKSDIVIERLEELNQERQTEECGE